MHRDAERTVIGAAADEEEEDGHESYSLSTATYAYDDDNTDSYQSQSQSKSEPPSSQSTAQTDAKKKAANRMLMPSAATLSFSVKGWLPSGIRVESLNVDAKKSKGLGGGVTPYKGVKYLCVSRRGVECRC